MYGEEINVYAETDPLTKEFMDAAQDYIQSLNLLGSRLPLYRIYPTKTFKKYVKIVRRMQDAGEY